MKLIFTFIFNVLRNISLILVLLFFTFLFFITQNESLKNHLTSTLSKTEQVHTAKESVSIASIPRPYTAEQKERKFDGQKKVKIKIPYGAVYLNPNEIIKITKEKKATKGVITLVSGEIIEFDDTIKSIGERLDSFTNHQFFLTRNEIISCLHVKKIILESGYKDPEKQIGYFSGHYAVFDYNLLKFKIDKNRVKEFKEKMEAISF